MLTKERFTHTKSPYDFLINFLGYTWLNLTNLLINLLGLSRLNLGLFLCEGHGLEGNQWKEEELRDLKQESVQLYIKVQDERFPDRKVQLKMFLLFSMQTFRKQVYDITSAESFSEEFEDMLSNFYCEEMCFTA